MKRHIQIMATIAAVLSFASFATSGEPADEVSKMSDHELSEAYQDVSDVIGCDAYEAASAATQERVTIYHEVLTSEIRNRGLRVYEESDAWAYHAHLPVWYALPSAYFDHLTSTPKGKARFWVVLILFGLSPFALFKISDLIDEADGDGELFGTAGVFAYIAMVLIPVAMATAHAWAFALWLIS